jgi:TatD DNase family protein
LSGLFDTHCHLDASAFDGDREAVWARAVAAGVEGAIVPAVAPATWAATLATATGERRAALGIHPHHLDGLGDADLDEALAGLVAAARAAGPRVVAVGECGFDGSTAVLAAQTARQRRVFFAHAEAARSLDLPLVVHVHRAHDAALAAMRAVTLRRTPGVIHSYSGGPDLARAYLAMGWHLALGGAATRPGARRPLASARVIPAERLLLETDAPDQTPAGVAPGVRRCEPMHLALVARSVAAARGESLDALAARTTANARALFRVEPRGGE